MCSVIRALVCHCLCARRRGTSSLHSSGEAHCGPQQDCVPVLFARPEAVAGLQRLYDVLVTRVWSNRCEEDAGDRVSSVPSSMDGGSSSIFARNRLVAVDGHSVLAADTEVGLGTPACLFVQPWVALTTPHW